MSADSDDGPVLSGLPGCGLATYGGMLIAFCVIGIIGSCASSLAILFVPDAIGPSKLKSGTEVHVWQLQPCRDAGVLDLTEIPLAWHDESQRRDGTTVCGFSSDSLFRVEDSVGHELLFADMTRLEVTGTAHEGMSITSHGPSVSISCHFGPGEGGGRFLKQLEVETGLTGS